LSSLHLPSPKTPSTPFVLSQSLNFALNAFIFLLSCLLCEAPKLAFTDSYIVLIADASDLDNFCPVLFRQFESLGAGQPLSTIRILSTGGGFEDSFN
jgi:hypothetical protein